MTSLVGLLAVTGKFVFAKPHWSYFSMAVFIGCIFPGLALLLGALPHFTHKAGANNSSI
jgi:hypothetical protein